MDNNGQQSLDTDTKDNSQQQSLDSNIKDSGEQQNLEGSVVDASITIQGVIENTDLTGTYNVMLLIWGETFMSGNQTGAENVLIDKDTTEYEFVSGMNMLVGESYQYTMYIDTNKNYTLDPGELKSVVTPKQAFNGEVPITVDFTEWESD